MQNKARSFMPLASFGIISILFAISFDLFYTGTYSKFITSTLYSVGILCLVTAFISFIFLYLQQDNNLYIVKLMADFDTIKNDVGEKSMAIDAVLNKINNLEEKITTGILNSSEKSKIIQTIQAKLTNEAAENTLQAIQQQAKRTVEENSFAREIINRVDKIRYRLETELQATVKRGNLNLTLGIGVVIIGIITLAYVVIASPSSPTDHYTLVAYYIPRISIAMFMEVFAYFFLKLYKTSLYEIKYFQNELTNVESKFIALLAAIHKPTTFQAEKVICSICSTERNFTLKKGETTIDLELSKLDSERTKGTISEMLSLFKQLQK